MTAARTCSSRPTRARRFPCSEISARDCSPISRMPAEWAAKPAHGPDGARASSTSTTTARRICSPPAARSTITWKSSRIAVPGSGICCWRTSAPARFEDVSARAGADFQKAAWNRGAAFGDLDGDGRVDVVVSRIGERAAILRNTSRRAQPLSRRPAARAAQQSGRPRRDGARHGRVRPPAVESRDDGGRLRLFQRPDGVLRNGHRTPSRHRSKSCGPAASGRPSGMSPCDRYLFLDEP